MIKWIIGKGTGTASGRILSGGSSLDLSRASPLSCSHNLELLRSRLFKLHFFLSSCLILFFGGFLDIGGGGRGGGEGRLVGCSYQEEEGLQLEALQLAQVSFSRIASYSTLLQESFQN